jgi:DeoR/GlpR family transcriptional regulator of sugar metabolism
MAADLVGPADIVGLNGGTTTTEVARALAVRAFAHIGPVEDIDCLVTDVGAPDEVVPGRRDAGVQVLLA